MMKPWRCLFTLLILFSPSSAFAAGKENAYDRVIRTGTLRCGVMLWPPYFDKDPNTGVMSGLGVDLYGTIASFLDIKIDFVEIVMGQQVQDLNQGKVDAVCNDGPYMFSAMKFLDYARPAYYAPVHVYVSTASDRFKTQDDLNKKDVRFIGMDGDLSVDLVQRNYPDATLQTMPGMSDGSVLMTGVTTGKADAVIIDPASVKAFNQTNKPGLKALFTDQPVVYPITLSVRKGETDLLNMINAGIDAAWNTNAAAAILKKYDPDGEFLLPVAKPYREAP